MKIETFRISSDLHSSSARNIFFYFCALSRVAEGIYCSLFHFAYQRININVNTYEHKLQAKTTAIKKILLYVHMHTYVYIVEYI